MALRLLSSVPFAPFPSHRLPPRLISLAPPLPSFPTSTTPLLNACRRRRLRLACSIGSDHPETSCRTSGELSALSGGEEGIWSQIKEIALFAGPATGLWICGPLMSLIDTMVIGQSSSLELAALGPATVVCDYLSYIFMFLSIATSNMVATSLAKKIKSERGYTLVAIKFHASSSGAHCIDKPLLHDILKTSAWYLEVWNMGKKRRSRLLIVRRRVMHILLLETRNLAELMAEVEETQQRQKEILQ